MSSGTRILLRCLFAVAAGIVALLVACVFVLLLGWLNIQSAVVAYMRDHAWISILASPLFLALLLLPFVAADFVFRRCMRAFDSRFHAPASLDNRDA